MKEEILAAEKEADTVFQRLHFIVKNANDGIVTVGMEGQFATAANLATAYDNSSVGIKFRFRKIAGRYFSFPINL